MLNQGDYFGEFEFITDTSRNVISLTTYHNNTRLFIDKCKMFGLLHFGRDEERWFHPSFKGFE